MTYTVSIPGEPRGKGSVRVGRWGAYKDERTENYMATCIMAMKAELKDAPPISDPTIVVISAFIRRPKALIPKDKSRVEQPPSKPFYAPVKPDLDNLSKSICDALTQAGVITDDSRIVKLSLNKFYVSVGENPQVIVSVKAADLWDGTSGWWER